MKKNNAESWCQTWTGPGEKHHQMAYGRDVLVTRLGRINIVHTDCPSEEIIKQRIQEVIKEEIEDDPFDDNCPLCQDLKKHPYDVVY